MDDVVKYDEDVIVYLPRLQSLYLRGVYLESEFINMFFKIVQCSRKFIWFIVSAGREMCIIYVAKR